MVSPMFRLAVITSSSGVILAQEIPSNLVENWGKLGLSAMCLGILAYLVLRTGPELFRAHIEAQERVNEQLVVMHKAHVEALDRLGAVHRETLQQVCHKIDNQTSVIQNTLNSILSRKETSHDSR